jgi:hypothetical protein
MSKAKEAVQNLADGIVENELYRKFLRGLKSGDEVAVAVQGQETLWRKAIVKHGPKHETIVVELGGREIEFSRDGVSVPVEGQQQLTKVLLEITPAMLDAVKRENLLRELAAYNFEIFTLPELEAILTVLKGFAADREPAEEDAPEAT